MTPLKLQKDFLWGGLDDLPLAVGMYMIKYTLFIKKKIVFTAIQKTLSIVLHTLYYTF